MSKTATNRSQSLRLTILWYLVLFAALPMGILLWSIFGILMGQMREDAVAKNELLASAIRDNIEQTLDKPLSRIRHIATGIAGLPRDTSLGIRLQSVVDDSEIFEMIGIVDTRSWQLQSLGIATGLGIERADLLGLDYSMQPAVLAHRRAPEQGVAWSDMQESPFSRTQVVSLAIPTTEDRLVLGTFDVRKLFADTNRFTKAGQQVEILVVDQRANLVIAPDHDLENNLQNFYSTFRVLKPVEGFEHSFHIQHLDKGHLGSRTRIDAVGWDIYVLQPNSSAFRGLIQLRWYLAMAALLALIAVLFGLRQVDHKVLDTISRLARAIRDFGQDRSQAQLPPQQYRELRDVATSFEQMAALVQEREALIDAERTHYRSLFESVDDGILLLGARAGEHPWREPILDANQAACRILGQERSALLQQSFGDMDEEFRDNPEQVDALVERLNREHSALWETRLRTVDGFLIPAEISCRQFATAERDSYIAVIRDIRERQQTEALMRAIVNAMVGSVGTQALENICTELARILRAERVSIARLSPDGDHLEPLALWNAGSIGRGVSYAIAGTPCARVIEEGFFLLQRDVARSFSCTPGIGPDAQGYVGIRLDDSRGRPTGIIKASSAHPLVMPDNFTDILHIVGSKASAELERLRMEEHLQHLAYHDALTELPNRLFFQEQLERALTQLTRRSTRLAVFIADLDRFKNLNDTQGHAAGDRYLVRVANLLSSQMRQVDLVARMGGDEFAILVEQLPSTHHAQLVGEKILSLLQSAGRDSGLNTSGSIGVAIAPQDGTTAADLIKHADIAMYRAKDTGRNNICFFSNEMQERVRERLSIEKSLRTAIQEEQFILHYQPIFRMSDMHIAGFETLIRWNHPSRGLVSPGEFIPVAEETGMILEIGAWVLHMAIDQLERWRQQQPNLKIAVNICARQLTAGDLIADVNRLLSDHDVPPWNLELELTESMLMENLETSLQVMQRLSGMGVRMAIDDFGTGYSSLAYLKRFPIHTLKIDRSFVQDMGQDSDSLSIVRSIRALAETLRLEVTAEGIETPYQQELLRQFGCEYGQGFLLGRPVPAEQAQELLKRS